jgi:hypothetical protein
MNPLKLYLLCQFLLSIRSCQLTDYHSRKVKWWCHFWSSSSGSLGHVQHPVVLMWRGTNFLPALVRMYVQRGSKYCFVVLVLGESLVRILHFRPISSCFQLLCILHVAFPSSLARQPCPARLLHRWQFFSPCYIDTLCPAALPSNLAEILQA